MSRLFLVTGPLLGGLAVAAGAFGAHGLKAMLEAAGQAGNWETAARYALGHALAIVLVGLWGTIRPTRLVATAGWCFLAGTAIFSGCLFALATSGFKPLGAIVPIGGLLLIVGWTALGVAGWQTGR